MMGSPLGEMTRPSEALALRQLGSIAWGAASWSAVSSLALALILVAAWAARSVRRTPALATSP